MRRFRAVLAALLLVVVLAGVQLASAVPALAGETSDHPFDPRDLPGVATIKAKARSGERPRFTWRADPDAVEYTVVVQDRRGRPYWAWRGPETTVFLGGIDEPSSDAVGPRLTQRAQFQVVAYDADGRIVGASPWRTVAP